MSAIWCLASAVCCLLHDACSLQPATWCLLFQCNAAQFLQSDACRLLLASFCHMHAACFLLPVVWCSLSDASCLMSEVVKFEVWFQISDVWCQTSDILCLTSDVWHLTSIVWCLMQNQIQIWIRILNLDLNFDSDPFCYITGCNENFVSGAGTGSRQKDLDLTRFRSYRTQIQLDLNPTKKMQNGPDPDAQHWWGEGDNVHFLLVQKI